MTTYDDLYFIFGVRLEVLDSRELNTLSRLVDDDELDEARSLVYSTDERTFNYA